MKLKGLLGALAPTIGSSIGGPMGGMAMKMVAAKLGTKEEDPVKIEKLLEDQPEKIEKLKEAENEFADQIRAMEIDLESYKTQTADIQDARDKFAHDPTPRIIAVLSMVGFLGYIFLVTIKGDTMDDAIVNLVLGYLGGLVTGVTSFYFGSSHNGNN